VIDGMQCADQKQKSTKSTNKTEQLKQKKQLKNGFYYLFSTEKNCLKDAL